MPKLPHITVIETEEGDVAVEVEDSELFDFVDDYLFDQGIEYNSVSGAMDGDLEIYTMFFRNGIKRETIEKALAAIPVSEIEKIFNINNSK